VKQAAYSGAQTLTGTARVDALQKANVTFRTGFKAAIAKLSAVKRDKRSNHQEIRECKKEVKQEKHEDKKEHKEEVKSQVKALKDRIKELKDKREDSRGRSGDRR
jgi:predicted nuclease with TOPRIM domain